MSRVEVSPIPARPLIPSVKVSKDPESWKPVFKKIIFQVAYRQLGMVSLHVPIKVAAETIKLLSKEGYGSFKWLIPGRIGVWRNVPVGDPNNPALVIDIYVFGSKIRQKNTVFVRIGWWKMYVIEAILASIGNIYNVLVKKSE